MALINNFCLFLQFKLRGVKGLNGIKGLNGCAKS